MSDALPVEEAMQKHQAPLYDSYIANIKVVRATPFKLIVVFLFGIRLKQDYYCRINAADNENITSHYILGYGWGRNVGS